MKNVAWSRLQKGHMFTIWELRQEGRALPCSTLAGNSFSWRADVCQFSGSLAGKGAAPLSPQESLCWLSSFCLYRSISPFFALGHCYLRTASPGSPCSLTSGWIWLLLQSLVYNCTEKCFYKLNTHFCDFFLTVCTSCNFKNYLI